MFLPLCFSICVSQLGYDAYASPRGRFCACVDFVDSRDPLIVRWSFPPYKVIRRVEYDDRTYRDYDE